MSGAPMALSVGVATAILVLASPGMAISQETEADGLPEHREGFWLSGGLGAGFEDEGDAGTALYIRLGGTLGDHWALGFDGIGVAHEVRVLGGGETTLTRSNSLAALYYFPSPRRGFYLKGGVGFSVVDVSTDIAGGPTISVQDDGLGAGFGAGWDLRVGGGNLYLTPNVDVMLQGLDDDVSTLYVVTLGIGFR